jgi:hypothetical protein
MLCDHGKIEGHWINVNFILLGTGSAPLAVWQNVPAPLIIFYLNASTF